MKTLSIIIITHILLGCSNSIKPPIQISHEEYKNLTNWENKHNDSVNALFNTNLYMQYDSVVQNMKAYFAPFQLICDSTEYAVHNYIYMDHKMDIRIENFFNPQNKLIWQNVYIKPDTSKYNMQSFNEILEKDLCMRFGSKRYSVNQGTSTSWFDGRREISFTNSSYGYFRIHIIFQYLNYLDRPSKKINCDN